MDLNFKSHINFPRITVVIMWLLFLLLTSCVKSFVGAVIEDRDGNYGHLPSFEELENPSSSVASEVYYGSGEIMGKYFRDNRTPIQYEDMSKNVINALLATEDIRFEDHNGVDLRGLISIPYYLLQGKKKGASTITQQLAKNLFKMRNKELSGKWTERKKGMSSYEKARRMLVIKMKEWVTATRLETSYTKNEIISMYLNTVDFGSLAFGLKVASQTFFSVHQEDLKLEEAAVLVGLLKGPSLYSPVYKPKNSLNRRNVVINQLHKYKFISPETKDSLKSLPLTLNYEVENHNTGKARYFRSVVGNYLMYWCKQNGYDLWADGLKVYTTIDSTMQEYAEQSVNEHMSERQQTFIKHLKGQNGWVQKNDKNVFEEIEGFLPKAIKRTKAYKSAKVKFGRDTVAIEKELNTPKEMTVFSWDYKTNLGSEVDTTMSSYDSLRYYKHFLHTGFMSMNPKTGEIKAWVGGVNYKHFQFDHVRQGRRQPGSTFKPIVYATILGEAGDVYSPCYKAVDAPVTFLTGDPEKPTWTPQNASGNFSGDTMTIRQAMARSKNSITAYMMKILGEKTPHMVKRYAEDLGISSKLEAVPAMCLGTFDISVFDMVGAYSTFANKGTYTKPYFISKIEDKYGNIIMEFEKEKRSVMSEDAAYTMLYMLRGATEESDGTGQRLRRKTYKDLWGKNTQIGAKTGTTQNYSDGWFMGVTNELVSGVWVGADDRSVHFRNIREGQGASMALPIWGKYMVKVYNDKDLGYTPGPFEKPIGFKDFDCSKESGFADKITDKDTITYEAPVIWGAGDQEDEFE